MIEVVYLSHTQHNSWRAKQTVPATRHLAHLRSMDAISPVRRLHSSGRAQSSSSLPLAPQGNLNAGGGRPRFQSRCDARPFVKRGETKGEVVKKAVTRTCLPGPRETRYHVAKLRHHHRRRRLFTRARTPTFIHSLAVVKVTHFQDGYYTRRDKKRVRNEFGSCVHTG